MRHDSPRPLLDIQPCSTTGWRAAGCGRWTMRFAAFWPSLTPTPTRAWLVGALASHQLGRGHPCLDLRAGPARLAGRRAGLLPEGARAANALMPPALWPWPAAATPLLAEADADAGRASPLVRDGARLYLRRYWQYEQDVAAALCARVAPLSAAAQPTLPDHCGASGAKPDWQTLASAGCCAAG